MPPISQTAPKTPAHYLPGLDVVRLAALLPVLCYHFCAEAATLGLPVPPVLLSQAMADWVEVGLAWFFLLSGAALRLQWQGRLLVPGGLRRYFVGRAAALYPPFWLGFFALFLYGDVLHGNNPDIPRWRVVFSVLGLDGYLAPVTPTFYKIGEWFLGVILILYLLFPLILWGMQTKMRRLVLGVALLALQLIWPLVCPAPLVAGHSVLGRLPVFALGVWLGGTLPKWPYKSRWPVVTAVVCGGLWLAVGGSFIPRLAVLAVFSAGLFWPVFALGQRLPAALQPALRGAAALSYCVYLVHHVLLTILLLPFVQSRGVPLVAAFLVYLPLSFVLAAVLQAVSRPLSRALRRLGGL